MPGRAKPLDEQIELLQETADIMQYMTPLQGSGDNKRSLVPGVDDPPVPPKKPRPDPKKPNKPPQKPSKIVVPDNCCSKTTAGKPICYYFNTTGCKLPCKKGRCRRGLHLCWRQGCGKSHPGYEWPQE